LFDKSDFDELKKLLNETNITSPRIIKLTSKGKALRDQLFSYVYVKNEIDNSDEYGRVITQNNLGKLDQWDLRSFILIQSYKSGNVDQNLLNSVDKDLNSYFNTTEYVQYLTGDYKQDKKYLDKMLQIELNAASGIGLHGEKINPYFIGINDAVNDGIEILKSDYKPYQLVLGSTVKNEFGLKEGDKLSDIMI